MDRSGKATRYKREENQRIDSIVGRREKVRAKVEPSEIVGLPSEGMRLTPLGRRPAFGGGKRRDLLILALVGKGYMSAPLGR